MIYIDIFRIKFFRDNGEHHRENGPAHINGDHQTWWFEGKFHRLDGPAYITRERQSWYIHGKRHRIDGPAVIHDYYQEWWIEGLNYSETDYYNKLKEMGLTHDIH